MKDRQLTPHFTLYELTATSHAVYQEDNRKMTREEEAKLVQVAMLLERCREILGCPLDIHSGRRIHELNKAVGSGLRSQHLKCEAADFSPVGPDTEQSITDAFDKLAKAARAGAFKFGQLIVESEGEGREGRKFWIHISLGAPYRDADRCGEILDIRYVDGVKKTILVTKLPA